MIIFFNLKYLLFSKKKSSLSRSKCFSSNATKIAQMTKCVCLVEVVLDGGLFTGCHVAYIIYMQ